MPQPSQQKKSFQIRYHTVEGDLEGALIEMLQEKVKSALSLHDPIIYNDIKPLIRNYLKVGNVDGT